jgi:cell division septal protein FtsQ
VRLLVRQCALALVVLAAAGASYLVLRATPAFSVDRVSVSGVQDPGVVDDVRSATELAIGTRSLLAVDAGAVARRLAELPVVSAVHVDRAFPHEVRVTVVPEVPAAIVTTATGRILIASSGRVIGPALSTAGLPVLDAAGMSLPGPGGDVGDRLGDQLVVASALLRFPRLRATGVGATDDGLVARLAGGLEVRLGDASALAGKLVLADAILAGRPTRVDGTAEPTRYVDVSVPDHPVLRMVAADAGTGGRRNTGLPAPTSGKAPDATALVIDLFVPTVRST